MSLENFIIKSLTKESSLILFKKGFSFDEYYSVREVLENLKEQFGYSSIGEMRNEIPFLSNASVKGLIEKSEGSEKSKRSFGNLLDMDDSDENSVKYRLKEEYKPVMPIVNMGLHTVISSKYSLSNVFGGDLASNKVLDILDLLRNRDHFSIKDISNKTKISKKVLGPHLTRLLELRIIDFDRYEEPQFRWDKEISSFENIEKIIKNFSGRMKNPYQKNRNLDLARQLFERKKRTSRDDFYSIEEIMAEFNYSLPKETTLANLASLYDHGIIEASNDFLHGKKTDIRLKSNPEINFLMEYVSILKGRSKSENVAISEIDLFEVIDIYKKHRTVKERGTQEERIIEFLEKHPNSTRLEIMKKLRISQRSITELVKKGKINVRKDGKINKYSLRDSSTE